MTEKRLYIAYGSNMNAAQMKKRCPNSDWLGVACLEGWTLTLPFFANIEPSANGRVPVRVWGLTAEDEKSLDRREGVDHGNYYKQNLNITFNGQTVSAMVYIMTDEYKKRTDKKARDGYVDTILEGYKECGFEPMPPLI